ncbi:oxidoreductase, partial [Nosema bombycis CQ1]
MKFNKIQIDHKKFTKLNFKEISTIKIELKEREIKGNEYSCNINNKTNISSEFNINENQNFTFEEKNHSAEKPNNILRNKSSKPTWREVYKVKLESKEPFVPGDSIGILCPNKDEFPQKIIKLLNLENDHYKIERNGLNPFKFTGKLYDFFKYVFDFTSLPK